MSVLPAAHVHFGHSHFQLVRAAATSAGAVRERSCFSASGGDGDRARVSVCVVPLTVQIPAGKTLKREIQVNDSEDESEEDLTSFHAQVLTNLSFYVCV